jgi:hypothetical protein
MQASKLLLLMGVLVASPVLAAENPIEAIRAQATFCDGTYALCIKAPCTPIPTLERLGNYAVEQASCVCDVVKGWSMGPGACEDRRPVEQGGRTYLISTYSNLYNSTEKTLSCPDQDTAWAWCYGAPCVVDALDPAKAICNCPVEIGPAKTLGGKCQTGACDSIWSAATPAGDVFANEHYYQFMQKNHPDVTVNPPAPACPASASTTH